MGNLFDMDSPLMNALNKAADCIWLSLLWLLCSLPIITIGASTTALYRLVFNMREDKAVNAKTFFKAFGQNFVQATLCWIVVLLGAGALGVYWHALKISTGSFSRLIMGFAMFIAVYIFAVTTLYIFPVTCYFKNTTLRMLLNSFIIGASNLYPTFMALLIVVVPTVFFVMLPLIARYMAPLLVLLAPGVIAYWVSGFMAKVFPKYITPAPGADSAPDDSEEAGC